VPVRDGPTYLIVCAGNAQGMSNPLLMFGRSVRSGSQVRRPAVRKARPDPVEPGELLSRFLRALGDDVLRSMPRPPVPEALQRDM
jgi:hypothetical protein